MFNILPLLTEYTDFIHFNCFLNPVFNESLKTKFKLHLRYWEQTVENDHRIK